MLPKWRSHFVERSPLTPPWIDATAAKLQWY